VANSWFVVWSNAFKGPYTGVVPLGPSLRSSKRLLGQAMLTTFRRRRDFAADFFKRLIWTSSMR
jgi:hypothetical protein